MADEYVSCERRSDGVAVVRLDRPRMNALSTSLLAELADVARALASDPEGAVVIWGGTRLFAAGADIAEFLEEETGRPGSARAARVASAFRAALDAVAAIPAPTISAIEGYALGGGCELALACDFRVVAETAKLGQPEILLGIVPGGGGTQRLARLVGPARAKDMIFTGRHVGAEEAIRIGLADRTAATGEALEVALEWAGQLARGPRRALTLAKEAIDGGADLGLADGLDLEARLFAEVFDTPDAATGISSFLDHGPGRARFGES